MEKLKENINKILRELPLEVTLIAVTKNRKIELLLEAYKLGLRDFGENRVQEMKEKQPLLPADIRWHLIGHLQTNKVKFIAPYVHLIHSVDSLKILIEINRQALNNQRVIDCLLQVYIAREESKFGLDEKEVLTILNSPEFLNLKNVKILGLMGMATFTSDENVVRSEFATLKRLFDKLKSEFFADNEYFGQLSMGMSGDYQIAIDEGSTMVRIGTALFGEK
ncbi:MAG: YggS family pyridoxal phosphate-dependent enzyme [Lentimicrobium sp.]|nr:YggS family pyridoxal phosphate-dependent enzyme [Lentimicrobium sp.]